MTDQSNEFKAANYLRKLIILDAHQRAGTNSKHLHSIGFLNLSLALKDVAELKKWCDEKGIHYDKSKV